MTPAERVADAVRKRREQLGLSQQDVVTRVSQAGGKLSINNYRAYEWGARTNPGGRTMADISRALEWDADALNRIFTGSGEPETVPYDDGSIAGRLARIEARMGGDAKLTDMDAMGIVLGCLSDEQYRIVALAVRSDNRYATVG